MKFLKGIMRKRDSELAESPPAMSIEALQRDLDHSGLKNSLRDPESAWGERVAQRPADDDARETLPASNDDPLTGGDHPVDSDHRSVSRDLDWEDELGDPGDAQLREAFDAPRARRQTRPMTEDSGREEFGSDDDDDDDEFDDFKEDDFDDEFDELDPEEERAIRDNALLVDEIRDAIAAVRHIETDERKAPENVRADTPDKTGRGWENDEVFGRKAIARDRLARLAESEDGDRVFEETASKMYDDDDATRRRQAMAHLKAAAAATKADRVLKRVVGRDPSMDPDEQIQYREDLANVVRQRAPRSEPVSRPLSRPRTRPVPVEATPAASEPDADPMTTDQLRKAFARTDGVAERSVAKPATDSISETNEPAEATMDAEKIDLKTALERQKAILKAEREALEAEIAAESAAEHPAEAGFGNEPEEDGDSIRPVSEAPEPQTGEEPVDERDEIHPAQTGEGRFGGAFAPEVETELDEWEDGLDEVQPEDPRESESEAPVDVTAFDLQDEPSEEPEAAEEQVRDLDLEPAAPESDDTDESDPAPEIASPAPIRRAGRVKTRLLGFQAKSDTGDVFAGKAATGTGPVRFPVGWLVVTQGAGIGHSFSLLSGVSKIGRGDDQAVQLDFGDTSISRDNHAAVAFDEELNQFFLGHGGKSNVVRLNGKPVLSTEELYDGDEIRIGETTLKFIALCGEEFTWAENSGDDDDHVRSA